MQIEALQMKLHEYSAELKDERATTRALTDDAATGISDLANTFLGPTVTPRMLMVAKRMGEVMSRQNENAPTQDGNTSPQNGNADVPLTDRFRQTLVFEDLTPETLDLPLTTAEAAKFLHINSPQNLPEFDLVSCSRCSLPKFTAGPGLHEFYPTDPGIRPIKTCEHTVCARCLLRGITASLEEHWFSHIDRSMWFQCPVVDCREFLDIRHVGELGLVLKRLRCKDIPSQIAKFERVCDLRDALKSLDNTTTAVIEKSAAIHARFISRGVMKSFFDLSFDKREPNEEGRIPPFRPGPIRMIEVDDEDHRLRVPIFMKFFRRLPASEARTCRGCSEVCCEIDITSIKDWEETCEGFPGDWMWKILVFPTRLVKTCDHEMDHCRACLAEHIKNQVDHHGREIADRTPCPTEGCTNKLSFDDTKLYADSATWEKYLNFLLFKALADLPNFRWCANGSCSNGQVYESDDEQIVCDACGYEMCFKHESPWHEDLSCEEYDNQKEYGDPAYNETQEWVKQNSKACPNCRYDIVKGEGCFHMTCAKCDHEFCWECLVGWRLVGPDDRGAHHPERHDEDCYFRTGAYGPTHLAGTNLQAALEAEERGEDDDDEVDDDEDVDSDDDDDGEIE
ncbi:hypothetical protein B0H63DRAFT_182036 [Podospora didyma]|uniref:RBR-type E3 ubiquitin transferase n=1 Tax=Podospora didyma TaxID=330526 RepID=A0AAE0NPN3_9PEZI|nr:hypothetical protein B0H63DRAFT_182036 [Podospora didyma]